MYWMALQVSLKQLGAEPGNHAQIEGILADVVNELIEEVQRESEAASSDPVTQPLGPSANNHNNSVAKLPLIRVRVDYTGFSTIHTLRFGQRFVNRVANPQDVLLWSKTATRCSPARTGSLHLLMAAGQRLSTLYRLMSGSLGCNLCWHLLVCTAQVHL
jgi:Mre11 DNA-binding presumed domain